MSDATPIISVVLPVYKAASTLAACIDSVLAQEFSDFELICVDDGSTDGSSEILDEYARRDSRVRVISQTNQGVSVARNTGMDAARGDILMFIDADDSFAPEALGTAADAFEANLALEVLVFGAVCEPEADASKHLVEVLSPADRLFERSAQGRVDPDLFFNANAQPYAWRAAFKRALIERENLRYEPGLKLAEDAAFQILAYSVAAQTQLISAKPYHYRMDSSSATHRYNAGASREQKLDQHLIAIRAILRGWTERGLADFYLAPVITWAMGLLLFDIARVPEQEAVDVASSLSKIFAEAYGADWFGRFKAESAQASSKRIADRAVLRVARAIDGAARADHFQLGTIDLVRFFVATRGFKQCVERFI